MEHIKYFFLNMSIIENANKFYKIFCEGWISICYMWFLKSDSYWCIFYFYNFIVFGEELFMFALSPVYFLQLEFSEWLWSNERWAGHL